MRKTNPQTECEVDFKRFSEMVCCVWYYVHLEFSRVGQFQNKLKSHTNKVLHEHLHFLLSNSPHMNSTLERLCQEVLRFCMDSLFVFPTLVKEWPVVSPTVQLMLRHNKHASLGVRRSHCVLGSSGWYPATPRYHAVFGQTGRIRGVWVLCIVSKDGILDALKQKRCNLSEWRTKQSEQAVQRQDEKKCV